jgi:protein-S-isoprenylcysteine O-methyltransferase Ste14
MTDSEIERLIELNKSDFEYKEWLALKYAQDWVFLNGAEPKSDSMADYQSHYPKEQREYIHKIMRLMRFTNSLGNTLSPKSSSSETDANSAVCIIQNREYSRKKGAAKDDGDHAHVIAPPPVIFGIILAAGLLIHRCFPLLIMAHSSNLSKVLANLLFVISGVIMVSTTRLMLRKKTALRPERPTTTIVTEGFFRYSRNPLYLSLMMIYSGIAIHANSLWLVFLLPVFFVGLERCVVLREETYLESKFGDEYLRYKKNVRRWI